VKRFWMEVKRFGMEVRWFWENEGVFLFFPERAL
jgi:hypothetical protein